MNIIEAYIKYKGQLLIFISGLSGCGKLTLGNTISETLNLKLIDQFNYYKKDYDETITLQDGSTLVNWYTDSAVDWDKFNDDISNYKKSGLIVVGFSLSDKLITSKSDYHFHLNIPKHICIDKRKAYLEENKSDHEEEYKLVGSSVDKLIMNQLIYPYYLETIKNSKINKFINVGNKDTNEIMSEDEIFDMAFDIIINHIKAYLYSPSSEQSITTTPKVSTVSKSNIETTSATFELADPQYSYEDSDSMDMVQVLTKDDEYDDGEGPIVPIVR